MNRLFKNFTLLCVFLFGWFVAIGHVSAQQEYIMGGFDQNEWKIGHKTSNQNQVIVEFVRLNEKIDSWTELLTMQVIRKPSSPEPLDDLVPKVAKTSALAPEKREQWIKELSGSKIIRR